MPSPEVIGYCPGLLIGNADASSRAIQQEELAVPESDWFIALRTEGWMEVNDERIIEGMWPENRKQFRRFEMLEKYYMQKIRSPGECG